MGKVDGTRLRVAGVHKLAPEPGPEDKLAPGPEDKLVQGVVDKLLPGVGDKLVPGLQLPGARMSVPQVPGETAGRPLSHPTPSYNEY